jgi:hypothetical protein
MFIGSHPFQRLFQSPSHKEGFFVGGPGNQTPPLRFASAPGLQPLAWPVAQPQRNRATAYSFFASQRIANARLLQA